MINYEKIVSGKAKAFDNIKNNFSAYMIMAEKQ